MTTYYQPIIVERIPSDIDASKHEFIRAQLAKARASIRKFESISKHRALEIAAVELHHSGVSACGYPDYLRRRA